jgi:hypothetical protein
MNTTLRSKRMFCGVFLLFAASWVAASAQAADSPQAARAPGSDRTFTTIEPRIAVGAVEDTRWRNSTGWIPPIHYMTTPHAGW